MSFHTEGLAGLDKKSSQFSILSIRVGSQIPRRDPQEEEGKIFSDLLLEWVGTVAFVSLAAWGGGSLFILRCMPLLRCMAFEHFMIDKHEKT